MKRYAIAAGLAGNAVLFAWLVGEIETTWWPLAIVKVLSAWMCGYSLTHYICAMQRILAQNCIVLHKD